MKSIEFRNIRLQIKRFNWQVVARNYPSRCALALLILVAGCAAPNSNIDSVTHQVATGERFLSAGEYTKGYDVLESVGRNNPDSAYAALKVADTYFAHNAYLRATGYYKNAIAKGNRTGGVLGLGRVMLATNQAPAAEQQFLAALSMRPHSPDALNGLGVALDMQGRHQEAQIQYQTLLQRFPTNKNAHNNLALSYILSGRHREASSRLGELARSYLDDPVVRQNFAISQVLIGDHKTAENTFTLDMDRKKALHNIRAIEHLSRTRVLNGT